MYAVFTLEEAVGVFALNENNGGLDTRGIAILVVHDLVGKAVTLLSLIHISGAQRRAIMEIAADCASGRPMNRLVQGDVCLLYTSPEWANRLRGSCTP